MELGYIKDNPKVQAMLYIGLPDSYGSSAKGVYNILTDDVNPSGGLYDIYASHSESSPAMVNMGLYEFTNKDDVKLVQNKDLFGRGAQLTTEKVRELIALRDAQGTGRIDTSSIGTGGTDFIMKPDMRIAFSIRVMLIPLRVSLILLPTGNMKKRSILDLVMV